jgi:hypothetical protein
MSCRGKRSQLFVAIGAFFVIFGSTASDALPPQADKPANEENWSIEESNSPTNGSPQVVAANLAGDTVLILRCKDQITEAAFSTKYNYLGYKSVDVQLQINDQNRIKEVWNASMNGRAVCPRRCGVHSILTGQWKSDDQDHAIRWESEAGKFRSWCRI